MTAPTPASARISSAPSMRPSFAAKLRSFPVCRVSSASSDWLPVAALILSLAYYYAVPSPLFALPGLLAFIVLAWLRLDLALCLLPLTFPFWFVPKHVAGSVVFPLSEIALAVCLAVALARGLQTLLTPATPDIVGAHRMRPLLSRLTPPLSLILARLRRASSPILIAAALLLIGTVLGVLIARRPHEALRALRWDILEPLLYAALILISLRQRHVRLLIGSFLGAALLLAALAAVQVFWLHVTFLPIAQNNRLIPYVTPTGGIPRATAFIFGSGNTLGAWMARALPLALALVLAPRRFPTRHRLLALLVALACIPALLWSDSRGALIAAVLACAVVAILSLPRPRWSLGVSLAALLVALVVLLARRAAVLNALLTGHSGSGEVRTLVWLAAWHMIRDHLLLGIGPDQFLYYYSSLYTHHPYWILYQNGHRTLAWTEPSLAQPHNLLLDLWLSGGLLALAGFLLALTAFWRRCWHLWLTTSISLLLPASPQPAASPSSSQGGAQPAVSGEVVGAVQAENAPAEPDLGLTRLQPASPAPAIDGRDAAIRAALALGLGASVLAGILHGMVDSAYFEPDLALLFWWSLAVLATLATSSRNTAPK